MKIYVCHSRDFDYKNELYAPIIISCSFLFISFKGMTSRANPNLAIPFKILLVEALSVVNLFANWILAKSGALLIVLIISTKAGLLLNSPFVILFNISSLNSGTIDLACSK